MTTTLPAYAVLCHSPDGPHFWLRSPFTGGIAIFDDCYRAKAYCRNIPGEVVAVTVTTERKEGEK
jgi:hypothetical protein